MSDKETSQNDVETYTKEDLEAKIAEATAGLKAKVDELLSETKGAKDKARTLEEQQKLAEEEGMRKREEFKALYERTQQEKEQLAEQYESLTQQIQKEKLASAAGGIASELTRDTARAALLQKEIAQFARPKEDGVVFEMGGIEVDKEKIVNHIKENYPFLVDGSGASGGGAAGGAGGRASQSGRIDGTKQERAEYFRSKFNLN